MREEKDAINSYEHTLFVESTEEEFDLIHPYSFGSTIIDNNERVMIMIKVNKNF